MNKQTVVCLGGWTVGMNGATSASLSNNSSQQAFGSSAANAGTTAPAFSSAGSSTSEDSFSKDGADQQAPKEKKRTWPKVLAAIAGVLTAIGLGCLTRSAIRNGHIAEQIEGFKNQKHNEAGMQKVLDKNFEVENGSVKSVYKETDSTKDVDKIKHPNAYAHMLEKLLNKDEAEQTKYLTDLKVEGEHKNALQKWLEKNKKTDTSAEGS